MVFLSCQIPGLYMASPILAVACLFHIYHTTLTANRVAYSPMTFLC